MFHVQFKTDGTGREVIGAVFCGPQDPLIYENLGTVERDDDRLAEFWASLPQDILISM